jgi:hypothetical protein
MVAFLDWMDRDNDGTMIDDGARLAAQGAGGVMGLAGAGLGGLGALIGATGGLAGGAIGTVGGGLLSLGLGGEMIPGLQLPATGVAALGAGMIGQGALIGMGSLAVGAGTAGLGGVVGLGGGALGTFGADVAEEVGDFTADALGVRGAQPVADEPIADDFYRNGRTDGLGQQLHDWMAQ